MNLKYRNRLEINQPFTRAISKANRLVMVVCSDLTFDLTKCNYREYIFKETLRNKKCLKAHKIGTISAFAHKGTGECENGLAEVFLNLLDFLKSYYFLNTPFKVRWYRGLKRKVKHPSTYLTLSNTSVWA
jgi:hypothetical protein